MLVGVAYYPEHWEPERWPVDARLMREAGFNVARLAEFAWGKMEPREGEFDFGWLDDAIGILANEGISVILGTPTESMPPWVARAYPEVVVVDRHGEKLPYGARRDNCPTSATYRRLGNAITTAMAAHYAGHPAVIGWQIDNEFSGPDCFCPACEQAWQAYLADKFGAIEALNRRWGTIFWSHTYHSWEEVPLPRRQGGNPSLELEFRRFFSRQVVDFQSEQIRLLRQLAPRQFITHNLCGFFVDTIDYYALAQELDVVGHDYYYNNSPWGNRFRVASYEAAAMDLMRSVKKRNFMVTETPSGPIGCEYFLRNLRPLEMRRMNFQAVGHGADGLLWFRWRTCRHGVEQYTHGLLGHDGIPGRRYADGARIAGEFHRLWPRLDGSTVRADMAIIYTYDNRWAMHIQPNAKGFDYFDHLFQYHRALKAEGVNVDFVQPGEDLSRYRVVVLPAGYLLTPDFAAQLAGFVGNGGRLLITTRSGVKDPDNIAHALTLPGPLRELAGIRLEEYEALLEPSPIRFTSDLGGDTASAHLLADWIIPETARVLARYEEPYLNTFAAVTVNDVGGGQVYYVGTCFVDDAACRLLIRHLLDGSGVYHPVAIPAGVDCSIREKGAQRFLFLMNHNDDAVEIDLAPLPSCRELLTEQSVAGLWTLPGGEVAVLAWSDEELDS